MSEREIARTLATREGGECEVKTPVGYIDVLTPKKLYEVKAVKGWKAALGQVLAYGRSFPDRKLCLYLYGATTAEQKRLIRDGCKALGVAVEWHHEPKPDEPPPPPKEVKPVANGMRLALAAVDQSGRYRTSCTIHLLTPTAPIATERLNAYMDEALAVFNVLLDNQLTLTLTYAFAGEKQMITRTRACVMGEHIFFWFNLSMLAENARTFTVRLPGMRGDLPSGHRLIRNFNYWATRDIPEINRLFDFILHPEFCWASQWSGRARCISSARWKYAPR